ncbi:hypothetical protein GcC1_146002 [Golovinomyces cichoracearum]|uniref:Uncharacterized protein n=1 Tax=Golovinomyces cichoracearum TaxID=62708 RepID=A0A420HYW6_9PEZI|nr:hypothetical protein GcC1_146002 [Golovinomyces cichoracearum]
MCKSQAYAHASSYGFVSSLSPSPPQRQSWMAFRSFPNDFKTLYQIADLKFEPPPCLGSPSKTVSGIHQDDGILPFTLDNS